MTDEGERIENKGDKKLDSESEQNSQVTFNTNYSTAFSYHPHLLFTTNY